jgi:hypothetical protein
LAVNSPLFDNVHVDLPVGLEIVGEIDRLHEARNGIPMQHVDVIEVDEVLDHQLPIAFERHIDAQTDLERIERQVIELPREVGQVLGERHRIGIERDEHPSSPQPHLQFRQAAPVPIETRRITHVPRALQTAVEVVGPSVIRTHELIRVALAARDLDTPMTAHVGVGADASCAVAA